MMMKDDRLELLELLVTILFTITISLHRIIVLISNAVARSPPVNQFLLRRLSLFSPSLAKIKEEAFYVLSVTVNYT